MFKDENRHYSLRKLSVGLASVLIGISFASSMNGNSVKADTVNGDSNGVQTVKVNDAVAKDSDAVVKTDAESAPEGQNQTPEAVKKDSGAITQDIKQKAAKASEAVAKLQNNAVKDNSDAKNIADDSKAIVKDTAESTSKGTNLAVKQQNTAAQGSDAVGDKALKANDSSVVQEDSSAKNNSLADKNNALKAKAEATKKAVAVLFRADSSETVLNLKGTNAIDPETLKENKIEAVVKADPARGIDPVKFASNGGFDPKIWGTMDTSKWQLDNDGNITGYTGDMSHIIIPNASDFAKVGKSYSQIGISYNEMKELGGNANSKADTLAISLTDNGKVEASDANWSYAFNRSTLKQANLEGLDTSNVTNMHSMFDGASNLTSLDVSNWKTDNVTDMSWMFYNASSLASLDVSNWDTSKVTNMGLMFSGASSLTSLDVSKWYTSKVTNVFSTYAMFSSDPKLDLIVNGDKFADYLVKNNFAYSGINYSVKSVTTDNTKLLKLLTIDVGRSDSATKTVVFTFPSNYSPDLAKYHLTKVGNTYQIKQSADYDKLYAQGTVLIDATGDITEHHIDTTKPYKLSDTWQPNYDKLVLAHKNSDGSVSFDDIQLPQIPGYKAVVKTVAKPANPASALFAVSFMALPKPATSVPNDTKPAETVTPATPVASEVSKLIETEPKFATTPKAIDLSADVVITTPKETTWRVANEPDQDTYHVSNGQYAVELPHISNAQLHVIANDSTNDSILFTYKGQNSKYVFNIKFVNGHYLLTTYKIKSGKLVKLIDYNFIKSSKMIDVILDWLQLE